MEKIRLQSAMAVSLVLIASLTFLSVISLAKDDIDNSQSFGGSSALGSARSERRIMELVNEERTKSRVGNLVWDSRLASLARSYSRKMANENFFGHKDGDGKNLVDRIKDFEITNWRGVGENLFFCKGYDDPAATAVLGWMNSAGHRSNLLKNSWKSTGVGIARSSDGRVYVTQVFMN